MKGGENVSIEEVKLLALEYAKLNYKDGVSAADFALSYENALKEIYDFVCTPKD